MPEQAERKIHVAIVDDDARLREFAAEFLRQHGFTVSVADGGASLQKVLDREQVDVVVLDIMMPGEDGLTIARRLAGSPDIGIIMSSALGSETDRIVGLEVGADDYLPKPVAPRELVARIRAVMRRRQLTRSAQWLGASYLFEGWHCDTLRRVLRDSAGVLVSLSHGEFSLLKVFLDYPGITLSRERLLELCHRSETEAFDRSIDTQVSRLRRKLGTRTEAEIIRTVRQEGYLFVPKVTRR